MTKECTSCVISWCIVGIQTNGRYQDYVIWAVY